MKKNLLLITLCSVSMISARPMRPGCGSDSCASDASQELFFDQKQTDGTVVAKWLRSIVPGVLVGGATGTIASLFVDDQQPWVATLLVWLLEYGVRTSLLRSFSNDYIFSRLPFHKRAMENSGFIASWLSYLYMREKLPFSSAHYALADE